MTERERTYALIKLKAGDWVLPSNDGQRFYRLNTYVDGPSLGLDIPTDRAFWQVHRLRGSAEGLTIYDLEQWYDYDGERTPWEYITGSLRSRAEAINEALRADEECGQNAGKTTPDPTGSQRGPAE